MTSNDIKAFALAHKYINKTNQTKFGFESSFIYKEGCFAKIQIAFEVPQAHYKSKGRSARFTNKKLSFSKRSIVPAKARGFLGFVVALHHALFFCENVAPLCCPSEKCGFHTTESEVDVKIR